MPNFLLFYLEVKKNTQMLDYLKYLGTDDDANIICIQPNKECDSIGLFSLFQLRGINHPVYLFKKEADSVGDKLNMFIGNNVVKRFFKILRDREQEHETPKVLGNNIERKINQVKQMQENLENQVKQMQENLENHVQQMQKQIEEKLENQIKQSHGKLEENLKRVERYLTLALKIPDNKS